MRDLNLSLKQLRYFLVASQHSSLRKAATELKITQPSLSAQLKLLEETLGVTLFERTRGGVSLTPIGRDLIAEARQAVNAAEAILDFANMASHGPAGTFNVAPDDALDGEEVVRELGFRSLPAPAAVRRASLRALLALPKPVPAASWLNLVRVPYLLDNQRALITLKWSPRYGSAEALAATRAAWSA